MIHKRWAQVSSRFRNMGQINLAGRRASEDRPKVIEVSLRGGLGNQLFGFAAGFAIARRLNLPLRLFTGLLGDADPNNRRFELAEIVSGTASWGEKRLCAEAHMESSFAYDPALESIPPGVVIDGYFQSEKYFRSVRMDVDKLIRSSTSFAAGRAELEGQDFIGLQIRRGDYLLPNQEKFHGLTTAQYFKASVDLLRELHGPLPIKVFTDDPGAASELIVGIDGAAFEHPAPSSNSLRVLGALSSARSLCISNSSFGWWAAWLSSAGGHVVAPRPWFRERTIDTKDLLPESWITLGSAE